MNYRNKKYNTILLSISESIAVITLNRPEVHNASNAEMSRERAEILKGIEADSDVKAVIFTGGNKVFSAGGDVEAMSNFDLADVETFSKQIIANQTLLFNLSKPTIAAVSGLALGGGMEQVLMCDIRIASDTAMFGLPEIHLGIMPGGGATQMLPRVVSLCKAKELIFLGNKINAQEALDFGIINSIVSESQLMPEALKTAKKLTLLSPDALQAAKRALNSAWSMSLEAGFETESSAWIDLFSTDNQKEGMNAFLEKRRPNFK